MKTSEYQPAFFSQPRNVAIVSVSLTQPPFAGNTISFYRTVSYWKVQA